MSFNIFLLSNQEQKHMFSKFLVTTSGKVPYIVKYYIMKYDSALRFVYEIYDILDKNILKEISIVDDAFTNNPENESFFKNIATKLIFSYSFSQSEALQVFESLKQELLDNKSLYCVLLPENTKIYYDKNKATILLHFINHFCTNYELIKLRYDSNDSSDSNSADNAQSQAVNLVSENLESYLFSEYVKLAHTNLVAFFLIKESFNRKPNSYYVEFTESNEKLTIVLSEYDTNFMRRSDELFIYVHSIIRDNSMTSDLARSNLNKIISSIEYLYKAYSANKLSKELTFYYLSIVVLLIGIYQLVLMHYAQKPLTIPFNIYRFANSSIRYARSKLNNKKLIEFLVYDNLSDNPSNSFDLDIPKINELAHKYSFLAELDQNQYAKLILQDYSTTQNNPVSHKLTEDFTFNTPKLIDLSNPTDLALDYQIIENPKLPKSKIISKQYEQLLLIQSQDTIIGFEVDPKLSKLASSIIEKVLPLIDKYIDPIKLNPSTLFIYRQILSQTKIEFISDQMFVLYRIVIPYLYDRYSVKQLIDNFH